MEQVHALHDQWFYPQPGPKPGQAAQQIATHHLHSTQSRKNECKDYGDRKSRNRNGIQPGTDLSQSHTASRKNGIDRTRQSTSAPQKKPTEHKKRGGREKHSALVLTEPDELRDRADQTRQRSPRAQSDEHRRQHTAHQCRRACGERTEGHRDISRVRVAHSAFARTRLRISAMGVSVREIDLTV